MIQEHNRVVLTTDLMEHDLKAGDVGTVVHIYRDGAAYEVEFFALDGHTLVVATLESEQIRTVNATDVMHVRERIV